MIKLTIEKLNLELEDLKNDNKRFEPNQSYLNSYIEFLKFFKNKEGIYKEDFIIGCHLVYGWMPTILYLDLKDFDKDFVLSNLFKVKNGNYLLDINEITNINKCVNHSMVGTSKLLHFINPNIYAIWDSNIFHYFFPDKKSTSGIEKPKHYLEYLKALKEITLHKDFDNLYFKIIEFFNLDYEISKYRAIESLIFEIMRNRKI